MDYTEVDYFVLGTKLSITVILITKQKFSNTFHTLIPLKFKIISHFQKDILATIKDVLKVNILNKDTELVLTVAFSVGKGMMAMSKHTLIMNLIDRFGAYEGNERCKSEYTANVMILSIGKTLHSRLVESLKTSRYPASISFDGSEDITNK